VTGNGLPKKGYEDLSDWPQLPGEIPRMYVFWSKQIGKIQQSRWVNHHIPHLHGNFGVCRMPDLGTEPCEIEVCLEISTKWGVASTPVDSKMTGGEFRTPLPLSRAFNDSSHPASAPKTVIHP
jgi:hypothetical protein